MIIWKRFEKKAEKKVARLYRGRGYTMVTQKCIGKKTCFLRPDIVLKKGRSRHLVEVKMVLRLTTYHIKQLLAYAKHLRRLGYTVGKIAFIVADYTKIGVLDNYKGIDVIRVSL